MAITKLSGSSLTNITKYDSFLAGNPYYVPPSFESIATYTLSSTTATVTFTSIPSTYKHLQLRFMGRFSDTGTAIDSAYIQFNGITTSSYARHRLVGDGSNVTVGGNASATFIDLPNTVPFNGNTAGIMGVGIIDIHDYASSTKNKTLRAISGCDINGAGGYINLSSGLFNSTSALTSISLYGSSVSWVAGSTLALYGIKG